MNWYKIHKTAGPLMPQNLGEGNAPSYNDIGHKRFQGGISENEEVIWAMDYSFDITEFVVEDPNENESHKKTHAYYGLDNPVRYCAKGRYEQGPKISGRTSLAYLFLNNPDVFTWSLKRKEYLQKNIIKTLDNHYNNPDIYQATDVTTELSW